MWPAALTRFLRRRILFLLIAIITIVYLLKYLVDSNGAFPSLHYDDFSVQRSRPLIWRTLHEHYMLNEEDAQNRTNDPTQHCRNTVQGRDLLTDDRGFVCARDHILENGCCNVELPQTSYYSCDTCQDTTNCCGIYEYCVSCCSHPSKRSLLELVLQNVKGRQAAVYALVEDQYELCVVKCRTNSHSVEHENKYRNVAAKYCYGETQAHESQLEVSGNASH